MTEVITGTVVAALFALIAYFLNRLITQNDRFQDETRRTVTILRREVRRNKSAIASVGQEIKARTLDPETKGEITSLAKSLMEVQKELRVVRPTLVKVDENHGKVILISEKLEAQESKIKGLYDTVLLLIGSKTDQK